MSTSWHLGPLCPIDLETTLPDPREARIVSAAVGLVGRREAIGGVDPWMRDWLVNPGVPIPPGATEKHGITDAMVAERGQDPGKAISEIIDVIVGCAVSNGLGAAIVGMNVSYDLTVLDREARRYGLPTLTDIQVDCGITIPIMDIYVLHKRVKRYHKGKRTLEVLANLFGVPLDNAHAANDDALAAARIAYRMGVRNPELQMPAAALHAKQVGWSAEQRRDLQDYFRKAGRRGEADGMDFCWPVCLPSAHEESFDDPEVLF